MSNVSKTKQDLLDRMQQLGACGAATKWVHAQSHTTAQAIWDSCNEPNWMLWYATRNGTSDKTLRQLACVFARSVLFLVPKGEDRPRIAIETAERFIEGHATLEELRTARHSAYAAVAYATSDAATSDAAAYAAAAFAAYAAFAADAAAAAAYAAYAAADAAAAAYAAADAAAYAAYAAFMQRQAIRAEISAEFCKVIRKAIPEVPFA